MIFHQTESGIIYQGNSLDVLKSMVSESVDVCVTSPPYWGLRDYGTADWQGGDADCDHKGKPFATKANVNKNTNGSNDTKNAADREFYKETCPKCGAVRVDSQLGLEKTPEEYVANMVALFREVRRVLKADGVLWLNLGDSYFGSNCGYGDTRKNNSVSIPEVYGSCKKPQASQGKPKDLVGIPWRVAFALQADGWYLRQDIIWHKPNPMPESVRDRCTKSHEYIFMLTKSAKYYFDSDAIKENANTAPHKMGGKQTCKDRNDGNRQDVIIGDGYRNKRSVWTVDSKFESIDIEAEHRQGMHKERGSGIVEKRNLPDKTVFIDTIRKHFTLNQLVELTGEPKTLIEHWFRRDECFSYPTKEAWEKVNTDLFPELLEVWFESDAIDKNNSGYRNKRSVWTVSTKPYKEAHFATYPPDLILPCILTSKPNAVILDPFFGSGTTGLVAVQNGRKYIGIDLNKDYCEIAVNRISKELEQTRIEL